MRKFLTFIKEFRIPKKEELIGAKASFSRKEFSLFIAILIVAFVAMIVLVSKVNSAFMVEIPAKGGTVKEGMIGMPTLVNPVLAVSNADKDVTALVYSGLMRKMPDASFTPDLAESFTVSSDGMTYVFIIKKDAKFHDGSPVTADDIIFTIDKIKDSSIKSPRKLGWDGINVERKDDHTIVFTLNKAYISFLDNTTIGILPMHIWKNISAAEFGLSAQNIKAIGSGPYKIESVSKNSEGIPEQYDLVRFADFVLGEPRIKHIEMISYANENDLIDALLSHRIDQASGLSPENANKLINAGYTVHTAILPRMFGVFFNSAHNSILSDQSVINAFDLALNREEIIGEVLGGYASISHSPIPETIIEDKGKDVYKDASLESAATILDKGGWTLGEDGIRTKGGAKTVTTTKKVGKKTVTETKTVNTGPVVRLAFSLTTGNSPELKNAANMIKDQLEKLGATIEVKIYEPGPLNQLIRERNYEALFFGQIVNHESDLFAFWHSSQKTDPGLNIALYGNKNADTSLEEAQRTLNKTERIKKYEDFVKEFNKAVPALLIYSPKYLYATSPKLNNINLLTLTIPSDRFASVYSWYTNTDHVWKIFTK